MLYSNEEQERPAPADGKRLRAADGYLFLGLFHEALGELEAVEEKGTRALVIATLRVFVHLKYYDRILPLARRMLKLNPCDFELPALLVFSLRRVARGQEARRVLEDLPPLFHATGTTHYNLACYEAKLGCKKQALVDYREAIGINPQLRKLARSDTDLDELAL